MKISLEFVPKGTPENTSFVDIMVRRRRGDKYGGPIFKLYEKNWRVK